MSGQLDIVDFITEDHGSVVIFTPMTIEAEAAVDRMDLATWQMWGGGFAVDRRVAWDLIDALLADGLWVQ